MENNKDYPDPVMDLSANIVTKEMELRPMTFGERLIGISFNPSGDEAVNKAKELFAEIADLTNNSYYNPYIANPEKGAAPGFTNPIKETIFQHAIGEILNAQMNVVKLLTLKY